MAVASGAETTVHADELDRFAVVLAAATLLLLPVARGWVLWSPPGGEDDIHQWVSTSPLDWPLALLVAVQVASIARTRDRRWTARARPPVVWLLRATLLWLLLAALVHPSWRAVDLGFHVAGAWALVRTARAARGSEQTVLLGAITLLGATQAVLGIAQSRAGDVLGLGVLEFEGPLYTFGASSAGRGSLTHPYHLTALLVVCVAAGSVLAVRLRGRPQLAAHAALAVMGVGIPLTFSRAVVAAIVPMVLLWAWKPDTRAVAAAVVVGLAVGLALGSSGVSAKTDQTVALDGADSGRRERLAEAWRLVEEEPVVGIGPGRYVIALREVEHEDLLPAHNIVAQAGAESGLPGGALVAATLVAFGVWLVRRRPATIAVGVSLLPFHLLDSYPHVFPIGLVITGTWLAVLAMSEEQERGA